MTAERKFDLEKSDWFLPVLTCLRQPVCDPISLRFYLREIFIDFFILLYEIISEIFMKRISMTEKCSLGEDLRALRITRKMTLEELAQKLGRSVGWLSQVERDISAPRMSDLRQIADIFGVQLSLFFGNAKAPEVEQGRIVRAAARRIIGERDRGLVETLISPDLTDSFEMIHSTFQPGSRRKEPMSRPTQEVAYMVSGKLDVWLDDDMFTVEAGDSFRIREATYRWANPYEEPAIAVWVISPPVY
jgi:transcriptional regulator with XRE-family HTH domain